MHHRFPTSSALTRGVFLALFAAASVACSDDPTTQGPPAGDSAAGDSMAGDPFTGGDHMAGDATGGDDGSAGDSLQAGDGPVLVACANPPVTNPTDVSVDDLYALLQAGEQLAVVDVREPGEHATGIIEGALLYPWTTGVLTADHANLPDDRPLYVICRSGGRSDPAAIFLANNGHSCVHDVLGGMNAWTAAGYPTVSPP